MCVSIYTDTTQRYLSPILCSPNAVLAEELWQSQFSSVIFSLGVPT